MRVTDLALTDFRCYEHVEVSFPPGTTVVVGRNGQGKTSLLEAIGWTATTRSFRGVPDPVLVREGKPAAVVRAGVTGDGRERLIEAEIHGQGRNRLRLDRQPAPRARDLLGVLRVTVFGPDDLDLVTGGPGARRGYLDDLLVSIAPRYAAARSDFERVLRHRNALLRQGPTGPDAASTLDVFDDQLVRAGAELVRGRLRLAGRLLPLLRTTYASLARETIDFDAVYDAEWSEGEVIGPGDVEGLLRNALADRRRQELERRVTLVGPHRDEWRLRIRRLDARTHASRAEQRCLALALRLAGHDVTRDVAGDEPVLLLDDVFSELDGGRAEALVDHLPAAQALVTTAAAVPAGVRAERVLRVEAGRVEDSR